MIEAAMYVALGFCTAGLIALAILPAFYRRASRLTEEALRAVNPTTYAEVRAAQDQDRARHAVELRRVEKRLEDERQKAAKYNTDASQLKIEIDSLKKAHESETTDFKAKIADAASDQKAFNLLSVEVKDLKQKLSDAEKALAESWAEREKEEASKAAENEKSAEWMPATDTISLATITGLESEVAALKSKLAKYEPSVAGEFDTERSETAKSRLAELEAQFVDTESKYITAQAEVTRLSLQLDASNHNESDLQKKLTVQLRALATENAKYKAQLQSKERAISRQSGQIEKLRLDLISMPGMENLRGDLQKIVSMIAQSSGKQAAQPAVKKLNTKPAPNLQTKKPQATAPEDNSMRPKRRARQDESKKKPVEQLATAAPKPEAQSPKTADIASAAQALVSRIVASNRRTVESPLREKELESQTSSAAEKTTSSARKSKAPKQKSKDVA
ncbi:MAG: hypothetical protein ABJL55_20180 [Roseibium sp.]